MNHQIAYGKLAEAALALGAVATVSTESPHTLVVDGVNVGHYVDVRQTYAKRSTWSRKPDTSPPKYRIKVGGYGRAERGERLPQRKDGSFDWERGAQWLIGQARREVAYKKQSDATVANTPIVNALRERVPAVASAYGAYVNVRPSAYPDHPVTVCVDFKRAMTVEKAEALIAALAAAGIANA